MGYKARFATKILAVALALVLFVAGLAVFVVAGEAGDPANQMYGAIVAGMGGMFLFLYAALPRHTSRRRGRLH